jgi:hypothetical protein
MKDTPTIVYTVDAAGDGHAALAGNPHRLTWHCAGVDGLGDVTLDDRTRPCGVGFDEHAFHVFAEGLFHVPHDVSRVAADVRACRSTWAGAR